MAKKKETTKDKSTPKKKSTAVSRAQTKLNTTHSIITTIDEDEKTNEFYYYYQKTPQDKVERFASKNRNEVRAHRNETARAIIERKADILEYSGKTDIEKISKSAYGKGKVEGLEVSKTTAVNQSDQTIEILMGLIVDGYSTEEIISKAVEQFGYTPDTVAVYMSEAKDRIRTSVDSHVLDLLPIHSQRYNEIYRKLKNLSTKVSAKVLKYRELIFDLHKERIEIEVTNELKTNFLVDLQDVSSQETNELRKLLELVTYNEVVDNDDKPQRTRLDSSLVDEAIYKALKKNLFSRSYYHFFLEAYKVLHPDEPYYDNWHIKFVCDLMQDELERMLQGKPRQRDLIINVPFRSAKSMICSVIFPVWAWTKKNSLKFIYVSYSESLALEHAELSKNLLSSDWFEDIYGTIYRVKGGKQHYTNNYGGFRKSVGTGGQITGSGGDILLCDDPQNPQKAASEKERENTISFYDHTLYSRLNQMDIGYRVNVQQRLHEQDLTGHLLEKNPNKYLHVKIPAEITAKTTPKPAYLKKFYKDGLFFPTRFSREVIDGFKKTLGSYQAAGQLQQEPAPDEGGILKRNWFRRKEAHELNIERNELKSPIKFFIDTAETEKTTGDATAILTCFEHENNLYVLNVVAVRKEFVDLCKFIPEHVKSHGYNRHSQVKIEPKSSGKSVVSQLRSATDLNVSELPSPTDDKTTRANAASPTVEAGRIIIVEGNWVEEFLDEVCMFPNAANDDRLDVLLHAIEDQLHQPSFDFTFL